MADCGEGDDVDGGPAASEEAAFQAKAQHVMEVLSPWISAGVEPEVFRSSPHHYRLRTKFAVAEFPITNTTDDDGVTATTETELGYFTVDEDGKAIRVSSCPIATESINELMPAVISAVSGCAMLREGLKAVGFLVTMAGDRLVSLIYGKQLGPEWDAESAAHLRDTLGIQVLGRSRGVLRAVDRDYVIERLPLSDGRVLTYKQVEGSFSNPNGSIATATLEWLCSVCRDDILAPSPSSTSADPGDLLELYCGNGNHTVALAPFFRRVVGVEINSRLVAIANENLRVNYCLSSTEDQEGQEPPPAAPSPPNAFILQIPAEKFNPGMLRRPQMISQAPWRDADYQFRTILVDPPRAGLDRHTIRVCKRFDNVLYISCCPRSLARDLATEGGLGESHEIVRMAILDHFPSTKHIECGVHLRRRSTAGTTTE